MADKKPSSRGGPRVAKAPARRQTPLAGGKATAKTSGAIFSAEERAAIQEYAREKKAAGERRARGAKVDLEPEVLAKIAAMPPSDRALAERIHAIVRENAPALSPKLWYGMPAYANSDGQVVCFFQDAKKFKTRYATLGFSDKARLDDGTIWPSAFALAKLTPADEARIAALLRKAVGEIDQSDMR